MVERVKSASEILGLLIIDPTTVQLGKMQREKDVVTVVTAKGRNGKNYFRYGSVEQILEVTNTRFYPLKTGERDYSYRLKAEYSLHRRFIELEPEQFNDKVIGADFYNEGDELKYNPRSLAVWSIFESSKYSIAVADSIKIEE